MENIDFIDKPDDWPQTNSECRLSLIYDHLIELGECPTPENKEFLLSLVAQSDSNEADRRGIHRVTDFEVAMINSIYLKAMIMRSQDTIIYLYRHIMHKISIDKWVNHCSVSYHKNHLNVYYLGLSSHLALFAQAYNSFIIDKDKTFAHKLIEVFNIAIQDLTESKIQELIVDYNLILFELSYNNSASLNNCFNFSRAELLDLFTIQSIMFKKHAINPLDRPLRGVLSLTIVNWILRSRNNYNMDYLYKCLSDDTTKKAIKNNEIWMQKIHLLNDDKEGKVVKDIFNDREWLKHDWVKNIDLNLNRSSYVSSFCKGKPNDLVKKEYGNNVYGFKNDIIRGQLAPLLINNEGISFSNVINYDILYSKGEFKKEINFLCDIINMYGITKTEKNDFLNHMIKYWLLSIKDEKWSVEKERRYEVFVDNDSNYIGTTSDDRFLKVESLLFTLPDFIEPGSGNFSIINANRKQKLKILATKSYAYCNICLFSNFDFGIKFVKGVNVCKNCGSPDIDFYENDIKSV